MPIVRMPDGAQVQFPDTMPPEEIRRLIATKFPEVGQGEQQAPAGPMITVAGQQIPVAEYQALSDADRQALRDQVAPTEGPQPNMVQDAVGAGATWLDSAVNSVPVVGPAARGIGDFIASSTIGGVTGQGREAVQGQIDQNRQGLEERFPMTSMSGSVTGAVLPMLGVGATQAGAQALGVTGANLASRMGASGASGGLVSAADTAARGGGMEDVRNNALIGAGVGAVVPGLGAMASAAGRGIGNIANTLRGATGNVDDLAASRVAIAQQADQTSALPRLGQADEAAAATNNQPLMNVDRGGGNTLALMRAASNANPGARDLVNQATSNRFGMQSQRTTDFFNRIMGGDVSDLARRAEIGSIARATNNTNYTRAMQSPDAQTVWNQDLQGLLQSDAVQRAVANVGRRSSNVEALSGNISIRNPFVRADDGTYRLGSLGPDGPTVYPNLQFWDMVKRDLDSQIGVAQRAGDKSLAGDLMAVKTRLTSTLDNQVPAYAQARSTAASFFGAENALDAGRNAWRAPRAIDESLDAFKKLSPADRQDFGVGLVSQIMDDVRAGNNRTNLMRYFDVPARKQLLAEALGPGKARELEAFVRIEDIMDRARGALGNSTTTQQLMDLGLTGAAGAGGTLALGGDLTQAGGVGLMVAAGRRGYQALGKRADAQVLQKVAEMLASNDPAIIQRATANAMLSAPHMQALEAIQRGVGAAARGGALMSVSQSGQGSN
ncbi:hypothetical protein [Pelagibacterium luteolum]|uniref:Uncharacterized protein n=1 Tax=Pelagibacterium luteolum TaxID=440168 RepID=A0A1G7THH9_9HYPH|nr:hypothetical protein [Pelagibacterium luteolum]SDG34474.1 hypothetical protein SAMN04487974_102119 [Pelagibacterium luteolum]